MQPGHYFLKNLPEGKLCAGNKVQSGIRRLPEVSLKKGKTWKRLLNWKKMRSLWTEWWSLPIVVKRPALAPTLVNVVDLKLFETTNSSTLSQGLNFQPGVRVETNCQNCGFQQVRINGLDGPYTQILIDSRPVFSALSGVYGLERIPAI